MKFFQQLLFAVSVGLLLGFSTVEVVAASNIKLSVGNDIISLDDLKKGQLFVGFGKKDINPDLSLGGVPLLGIGSSEHRVATLSDQTDGNYKLQQSLYATAIAIMDKDKNVVILITADLCNMSNDTILNKIKSVVSEKTGVPSSRIMFSTTHTHSAPDVGFSKKSEYPKLYEAIEQYKTKLYKQVAQASYDALMDLSPATMSIGTTDIKYENGSLNFVRNYKATPKDKAYNKTVNRGTGINEYIYVPSKSDSSKKTWITNFDMNEHQTEADKTLQIIKFERGTKKNVLMINWQVHPVITASSTQKVVSSDFVENLRNTLEKNLDCKVAYFTGGAANLNPYTEIDSEKNKLTTQKSTPRETKEISEAYGAAIAGQVKKIYNKTSKVSGEYVKLKQEKVNLKYRTITDSEANNASYIKKIYNSSASDIAKMIEGSYVWPSGYKFPLGFDKSGAKLRQIVNFSGYLKKVFNIEGNDKDGYKCTVIGTMASGHKTSIIKYIGSMFEDYHIHSLTHANVIDSRKKYNGKSMDMELSTLSLGSVFFAMAPYEMFDITAKTIRNDTMSKMTFVMSLTNGKKGYIPTKDTYSYECYENSITYFPKGTAEKLSDEFVEILNVSKIDIKTKPKKLVYIQNKENLELDGGTITVHYYDNTTKVINMDNASVIVKGFSNKNLGDIDINVSYRGETTSFKVSIIIEKPNTSSTTTANSSSIILKKGDVNGDGKVSSTDYIAVRKHILKQTTLTGDKFTRADITGDKKITSLDYIAIRKIILKK